MNTEVETISINGVEYVKKDSAGSIPMGDLRIIVADKGWVFVGRCLDHGDGSVTINNAKNIRTWGTCRGLGELVDGPIANKTKFDEYGTVRCTPIVQIAVNKGW